MDAATQLALMTKAKLVFETPDTFLSFPVLTPISFRPEDLDFSRAQADLAVGAACEDFSRAVSRCLTGPIDNADGETTLWDRYDAWLTAMQLASSDLSAEDQTDYAAARALLVVVDADNRTTDSAIVAAYKHCRDAVLNAEQAYKAAEVTATAAGTAALAAWQSDAEPLLRAAIATANTTWQTTGHRTDVEAAQATLARCEARMPQAMWTSWRNDYDPSVDCVTNPSSGATYAPSGFAPSDLVAQDWTTLDLTAAEIASLSANAPAALHALFGDTPASGSGASTMGAVSFEFRSAAVTRPWFDPTIFNRRFWKFADGEVLSDGATTPTGSWTAIVVAVVFVRNIQITASGTAAGTTSGVVQAPQPVHALPRPVLPPEVWNRFGGQGPAPGEIPRRILPGGRPMPMLQAMPVAPPHPQPVRPPIAAPPHPSAPAPAPAPAPIPAPPSTPAATDPADDRISILAFICQPLPKTPDPDPALTW